MIIITIINMEVTKHIQAQVATTLPHYTKEHYSRSYAEDVTSVTSGPSQGPHSFNLVFVCLCVCLFVCVTPGAIRI